MTISKISNLTGEPEVVDSPKMHVGVIEADADCSFHSKGGVDLERVERAKTFVMPAGRAYFVIRMDRLHAHSTSEYVSFLLEDGREYEIRYNLLRNDEPSKIRYAFAYNRLEGPDRKPVPVDVDHWSICEREKKMPKH